mgnify:CR=1 FL=1
MDPCENTHGARPHTEYPEARQDYVGPAPRAHHDCVTTWTPAGKTVPVATLTVVGPTQFFAECTVATICTLTVKGHGLEATNGLSVRPAAAAPTTRGRMATISDQTVPAAAGWLLRLPS